MSDHDHGIAWALEEILSAVAKSSATAQTVAFASVRPVVTLRKPVGWVAAPCGKNIAMGITVVAHFLVP